MEAYTPSSWSAALALLALGLAPLAAGYALQRARPASGVLLAAWALLPAGLAAASALAGREPAGVRMLALCLVSLTAMKAVVPVASRARGRGPLGPGAWLVWCAWLGMRPEVVARRGTPDRAGAARLLVRAAARIVLGVLAVLVARAVFARSGSVWLATAPMLVGLSLLLHFGWMTLQAAFLRALGYDALPLFRAPLAASSLSEFWGRRWNLAFTQMTQVAVYAPLAGRLGRRGALLATFLWSGLMHEVAISLPVGEGYGGPTAYFVVHGALVLLERGLGGTAGRPLTLVALAAPVLLLFHRPFLSGVVWPLFGWQCA